MISDSLIFSTATPSPALDILFVDDDAILRAAFAELLRREGYTVQVVADGRKALEFLMLHQPRLIITDIFMPDMDGIELIMQLRKSWPLRGVLAISGGGCAPPDLFLKTARLIGTARTLLKPFTPGELLAAVREMTGLSAGARDRVCGPAKA